MKKPDRWDRMVQETSEKIGGFWSDTGADLLRKEHRWVMRMVKKVSNWQAEQLADNEDVCSVILEQLKQRRK